MVSHVYPFKRYRKRYQELLRAAMMESYVCEWVAEDYFEILCPMHCLKS